MIYGCCNVHRLHRHWSECDQKYRAVIGRHFHSVILLVGQGKRRAHLLGQKLRQKKTSVRTVCVELGNLFFTQLSFSYLSVTSSSFILHISYFTDSFASYLLNEIWPLIVLVSINYL